MMKSTFSSTTSWLLSTKIGFNTGLSPSVKIVKSLRDLGNE